VRRFDSQGKTRIPASPRRRIVGYRRSWTRISHPAAKKHAAAATKAISDADWLGS